MTLKTVAPLASRTALEKDRWSDSNIRIPLQRPPFANIGKGPLPNFKILTSLNELAACDTGTTDRRYQPETPPPAAKPVRVKLNER